MERVRRGHLPDAADYRAVGNVEVRNSVSDLRGEPERAREGIRKRVARDGRRIVVLGLAISVGASELEAVAHPLLNIQLKGIIGGASSPKDVPDTPEVRVDP